MRRTSLFLALVLATAAVVAPVHADPARCERTLVKRYTALAKKALRRIAGCVAKENAGRIGPPCPDAVTAAKLALAERRVAARVAAACAPADAAALGFGGTCALPRTDASTAEAACVGVAPASPAGCAGCWQRADVLRYLALLHASHAVELCGGAIGDASPACAGGCADAFTPVPDQGNLQSAGERDCQTGVTKAGITYLLKRAKLLARCARTGGTREACLADARLRLRLAKADGRKAARIAKACGSRRPVANAPFCCRTTGNSCVAAADRGACIARGGSVQEGKTCGAGNRCDPAGGGQTVTWWARCPRRVCAGDPIGTIADLATCVRDTADDTVDALLCARLPGRWPCVASPSGAFVAAP
jgi:hypothetical protein